MVKEDVWERCGYGGLGEGERELGPDPRPWGKA
jgi:hypothetical protein